jgi:hypothetical protein
VTVVCTYFSPTTPTATTWSEDLSDYIRLGGITGLSAEARLGATGVCSQVFDDAGSLIGHAGDGIVGLKQMFFDETACPAGNQRLWTGYVGPRTYRRGQNSLRLDADREIEATLVEVDDFLSFRVFAPEADDPTSDFAGLAETDLERVQRLLTEVDFLSTTLFDIGYIPSTGGVDMDAKDYTGSRPIDVLNDCAQVSGRNFFVLYDEATNQLVLWYDEPGSDGSATLVYDSALRLTNVASEHDGTTTFAVQFDAEETLDPSRLISAIYGTGTGVTGYETLAATANTYAWRDAAPFSSFVSTQTALDALLTRYLSDNSTEDPRIRCTVKLPNTLATGIHKGQRIQVHFTHLPSVNSGFFWCRVMALTIRQDKETPDFYWLDLELSPNPIAPGEPSYFTSTQVGGCEVGPWPEGSPPEDALLVGFLVTRDASEAVGLDPGPIGTTNAPDDCDPSGDIVGTEWTYVMDAIGGDPANQSVHVWMSYRMAAASEPDTIRWGNPDSLNGTSRPRSHQIAIAGLSGAPTVTASNSGDGGAMGPVMTSPPIVVTGPGYIFAGFGYRVGGPAEGGQAFTLSARAPAQDLTQGYAYGGFGPYSWFGFIHVTAAMFAVTNTYDITVDRTAYSGSNFGRWWLMGFWPE